MFIKTSLNSSDMKNCTNKNSYMIYSERWHNLMKTYRILLKVKINAEDG